MPTAAAAAGVSLRSGGGIRRGILKRPTRASTSHTTISSGDEALPYVPAPVPEIIANIEDARIVERDSDLTAEERAAKPPAHCQHVTAGAKVGLI